MRVEHVKHSQCRKDFLDRVHANEVKKKEAKTTGKKGAPCKRLPQVSFKNYIDGCPVLSFKLFSSGSQGGSPGVHKGQRAPGKVKD